MPKLKASTETSFHLFLVGSRPEVDSSQASMRCVADQSTRYAPLVAIRGLFGAIGAYWAIFGGTRLLWNVLMKRCRGGLVLAPCRMQSPTSPQKHLGSPLVRSGGCPRIAFQSPPYLYPSRHLSAEQVWSLPVKSFTNVVNVAFDAQRMKEIERLEPWNLTRMLSRPSKST